MKSILLACHPAQIDPPLRRSLAHLAKSCQIAIAHNGHQVFEELTAKAFDLIIIDFAIAGIDSLELVESIPYIDPGLPVILIIPQAQAMLGDTARRLKAHPIIRPFKALTFLRLVDKLLHQQLDRYRQLARTLESILETLRASTGAPCAFLVEESGQILISNGEISGISIEAVGDLVVQEYISSVEVRPTLTQNKAMYVYPEARQAYGLYTTAIGGGLRLALVLPAGAGAAKPADIWLRLDKATVDIQTALQHQGALVLPSPGLDHPPRRQFIPLHFQADPTLVKPSQVAPEAVDETAINWQIISRSSNLLTRLHEFCRVG